MNFSTTLQCWVHMLRKSGRRAFYSLFFALLFLQYISYFLGYMTKWLIFEEFAIFLNHRILTGKWVDMLRIIHLPFTLMKKNQQAGGYAPDYPPYTFLHFHQIPYLLAFPTFLHFLHFLHFSTSPNLFKRYNTGKTEQT